MPMNNSQWDNQQLYTATCIVNCSMMITVLLVVAADSLILTRLSSSATLTNKEQGVHTASLLNLDFHQMNKTHWDNEQLYCHIYTKLLYNNCIVGCCCCRQFVPGAEWGNKSVLGLLVGCDDDDSL